MVEIDSNLPSRIWSLFATAICLILSGCTQTPINLYDRHGDSLKPYCLHRTAELLQATEISYRNIKQKTDYGKQENIKSKLIQILDGERLKLPINGKVEQVSGWSATELTKDKIFICGGCVNENGNNHHLDRCWLFKITENRLEPLTPLVKKRSQANLIKIDNDNILVSGGYSNDKLTIAPEIEQFNLNNNRSCIVGIMNEPRLLHTGLSIDKNSVAFVGGITAIDKLGDKILARSIETFDTHSHTKNKLKCSYEGISPIVIVDHQQLIIVGGANFYGPDRDLRWIPEELHLNFSN